MFKYFASCIVLAAFTVAQRTRDASPASEVPSDDYVDRRIDGSYRFGYKNLDLGGHYHSASATRDNTISGGFGSRDPASRRLVHTAYTAGRRGFRARGPNIARLMDLSQSKIPYRSPIPSDSPDFQPTYDGYHNPNEDPSYKFDLKTATYSRGESADSKGTINGAYSFVDDVGKRHDVQYEAGSGIGFIVKTPFPDSEPYAGLFYRGPNKPGTPPRGHSSILQNNDGSYQFSATGPDQKRVEISDSIGRVRGSYTYIDDKGVQRTVHYVAGPNIGYKIIRKGVGPVYSPIYPYTAPEDFLVPPPYPSNVLQPPGSSAQPSPTLDDAFNLAKPNEKPSDFDGDNGSKIGLTTSTFLPEISTERPVYFTPASRHSSKPFKPNDNDNSDFLTGSGYRTTSTTPATDESSINDLFEEKNDDNDYGRQDDKSWSTSNPNGIGSGRNDVGTSQKAARPNNGYLYPKPDKDWKENSRDYSTPEEEDSGYSATNRNFMRLPSGVSVRAHVQSLDIVRFGWKIPPPEEALRRDTGIR